MNDLDADLRKLFQQPTALPGSKQLLDDILLQVEQQQRRRTLWLWTAALVGIAVPLGFFASMGRAPDMTAAVEPSASLLAQSAGHLVGWLSGVASLLNTQAGLAVVAALGLVATGFAAARAQRAR